LWCSFYFGHGCTEGMRVQSLWLADREVQNTEIVGNEQHAVYWIWGQGSQVRTHGGDQNRAISTPENMGLDFCALTHLGLREKCPFPETREWPAARILTHTCFTVFASIHWINPQLLDCKGLRVIHQPRSDGAKICITLRWLILPSSALRPKIFIRQPSGRPPELDVESSSSNRTDILFPPSRTSIPRPYAPAADALNSDGSAFEGGFPCFVCWVLIVVAMPITSFALGTWQVYRLQWKKGLIEKYSNNLAKPPIILPKDVRYSIVKVCKLIV